MGRTLGKPDKYTLEFVTEEVQKLYDQLMADESIIYIGQLFINKNYSRERFSEWNKNFAENEKISSTIKKIKEILETRVVARAMNNDLNTVMTIFHLKHNYGWKDLQSIDHTSKGERITFGFEEVTGNAQKNTAYNSPDEDTQE